MTSSLVVNLRKSPYDVYIGRRRGERFHYGNPFSHLSEEGLASVIVGSREAAVQAFSDWLEGLAWPSVEPERRQWILDTVHTLAGRTLGCFCAPKACHGDVLKSKAEVGSAG